MALRIRSYLTEMLWKRGSVRHFLFVLTSKITQADKRQQAADMKRGIPTNIYRLGHWFEAKEAVERAVKGVMDASDKEALYMLKKALAREFTSDFSPAKYVSRGIDKFLSTGKMPSVGGGGTEPVWK